MTLFFCLLLTVALFFQLQLSLRSLRPALFLVSVFLILSHLLPMWAFELNGDPSRVTPLAGASYAESAIAIATLGSLALLAGYILPMLATQRQTVVAATQPFTPESWISAVHAASILALLGLIASRPQGVAGFVMSGFERLPVTDFFMSLTSAISYVFAFSTTIISIQNLEQVKRPPWLSILLLTVLFWALGGRVQLFITATTLALIYVAHGSIKLRRLIAPGIGLFVLLQLTLYFRLLLQGSDVSLLETALLSVGQVSLLDGYGIAARYVDSFGHHYALYLETIQQVIPRIIYDAKPTQISRIFRLMVSRDYLGGLTAGLFGELFAMAGYAAVAALGFGYGLLLSMFDRFVSGIRRHSPWTRALVLILIPILTIFTLRGGFDTSVFRIQITVFVFLGLAAVSRILHSRALPMAVQAGSATK